MKDNTSHPFSSLNEKIFCFVFCSYNCNGWPLLLEMMMDPLKISRFCQPKPSIWICVPPKRQFLRRQNSRQVRWVSAYVLCICCNRANNMPQCPVLQYQSKQTPTNWSFTFFKFARFPPFHTLFFANHPLCSGEASLFRDELWSLVQAWWH